MPPLDTPITQSVAKPQVTHRPTGLIEKPVEQSTNPGQVVEQTLEKPAVTQGADGQPDFDAMLEKHLAPFKAEIQAGVGELRSRVEQSFQPKHTPWAGGGPAVVRRNGIGTQPYSYWRCMQAVAGLIDFSECVEENNIAYKLEQAYKGTMSSLQCGPNRGPLMPLDTRMIADIDQKLADEILEQSISAVRGMDPREMQRMANRRIDQGYESRITQALSIYDDTYLGAFISFAEAGEMVSFLRAMEIFSTAGARQVTFLPNGTYPILRHTGTMTAYWLGKGRTDDTRRTITKSNPRTGAQQLVAKKLGAAIGIPEEFSRFGAGSTEAFIRADIADMMALTLDVAIYEGPGTAHEPYGVKHDALSYTDMLLGDNGNFFRIEDLEFMVATMQEQNIRTTRPTFVTRPMMSARIRTRRADAVAEMDAAGPFVAMQLAMGNNGIGYPLVASTSIPGDLTKGDADNLTEVLCFEPSEVLIARLGVMEFNMTDSHGTEFLDGVKTLKAVQYVDAAARRREAFVLATQLIQDNAVFEASSP